MLADEYGDGYMDPNRRGATDRTVCCAYCGQVVVLPSRRGPAPTYCCPSHRQAAYRARRRAPSGSVAATPVSEVAALRRLLAEVASVDRWAEARRVLTAGLRSVTSGTGDVS